MDSKETVNNTQNKNDKQNSLKKLYITSSGGKIFHDEVGGADIKFFYIKKHVC